MKAYRSPGSHTGIGGEGAATVRRAAAMLIASLKKRSASKKA
jgi:hypothetical protein